MKKTQRRILSFTLALMLIFVLPTSTSAEVVEDADVPTATMTWDDLIGSCTMTLCFPEDSYKIPVPVEDASIVHITQNTQGVITWPAGICATLAPTFTPVPSLQNQNRLETLGGQLGYNMCSMSSAVPAKEYHNIPLGLLPGYYSYGSEFTAIDAFWDISRGQTEFGRAVIPGNDATEGEIVGIPLSRTAPKLIVMSLD